MKRIGFIMPSLPLPYHVILASYRLRVYDIIRLFRHTKEFYLERYKQWHAYDAVLFVKCFDREAYHFAKKLRKRGTKIILDLNYNHIDDHEHRDHQMMRDNLTKFIQICDVVLTTTQYLCERVQSLFTHLRVRYIPELIDDSFFKETPRFKKNTTNVMHFVFSGYAKKARDIILLSGILSSLGSRYTIMYTFICERDPHITVPHVATSFNRYNQRTIASQLRKADIYLAPRHDTPINNARSFTQVGYPMAAGLPVLASPLPAYKGTPAVCIENFDDCWIDMIEQLYSDETYYQDTVYRGVEYCRHVHGSAALYAQYYKFFNDTFSL